MDRSNQEFSRSESFGRSITAIVGAPMEEKPKTANAMSKPRRALSVKSRLEPLEGTRGVGPKLRATASGRDLVPMMEESASFSQQFVTVRPTASDGDMTSLITTTKQRALEAAENRRRLESPTRKDSPDAREQKAFKTGAPPVATSVSSSLTDVPFVHLGGSPDAYTYSPLSRSRPAPGMILAEATGRALLEEWMASYDVEKRCYNSATLEAEVKLKRAEVFTAKLPKPNALTTAVAFEVFDDIAKVCGRYEGVLTMIKSVMLRSVYKEFDTQSFTLPSFAFEITALESYYRLTPYFGNLRDLEVDRDKLKSSLVALKDAMLSLDQQRKEEVTGTKKTAKVVSLWKKVAVDSIHEREVNALSTALMNKSGELTELQEHLFNSVDGIMEMFMALGDPQREVALTRMLGMMQEFHGVFGRWLLAAMPKEQMVQVIRDALAENDEVTIADIIRTFCLVFKSERMTSSLLGQASIIRELLLISSNIGPLLPAVVAKLTPVQRVSMSRCLAGVDSSPIPDVVLVDFLEAQEKADSVGEEKPKDEGTPARAVPEQVQGVSPGMFSSFLAGLTQAEKLQLLSDTLVETGHLAFPAIANALTTNGHPLSCELDECEDAVREKMVIHTTRAAPQWMLCKHLSCGYHNHSGVKSPDYVERKVVTPPSRDGRPPKFSPPEAPSAVVAPHVELSAHMGLPKAYLPLAKYLKKPPAGVRPKARDLNGALSIVYEVYERKIREDTTELAAGTLADDLSHLGEFLPLYLTQKYGLPSLSDSHLFGLVDAVRKMSEHSWRLKLFGLLVGILNTDDYTPRLAATVLHIIRMVFPKFTVNTFRSHRTGMLPIPLSVAHSVITSVFPESSPEVSFDTVQLTGGRRESFIQEVKLSAETYKSAAQRMQAVAAASTSAMLEESDAPLFDEAATSSPTRGTGGTVDITSSSLTIFRSEDLVIDFDKFLQLCVEYWILQSAADMIRLRDIFIRHAGAEYQRLTFASFCTLLSSLTSRRFNSKRLAEMFEQINLLDGNDQNDAISPEMFLMFCRQHGFIPSTSGESP